MSTLQNILNNIDNGYNIKDLENLYNKYKIEHNKNIEKDNKIINILSKIIKDSKIDIELKEHPKFYSIYGRDTIYYKDKLPMNGTKKPLFNKKYGWMYFRTDDNKKNLENFINLSKTFKKEQCAPLDKEYGIIAWDIKYNEPKWVTEITGDKWDPKLNPIKMENGTWKFQKGSITNYNINKASKFIINSKKDNKYKWNKLFTDQIILNKNDTFDTNLFNKFIKGEYISATIGWTGHARYMYKDDKTKTIYVYDPWKKNVDKTKKFIALSSIIKNIYKYKCIFVNRKKIDQAIGEGSCNVVAFLRAILIAEYGIDGATMEIPMDYVVIASRLISKYR
jgi:hypothetical protein